MKKTFLILTLILVSTSLFARDFLPVKLIYLDGKIDSGFAKEFKKADDKNIIFKTTEKNETVKIPSDDLKTIIFDYKDNPIEYDRVRPFKFYSQKKLSSSVWLHVIKRGIVTLYDITIEGTMFINGYNTPTTDTYWFFYREGELGPTTVSWDFNGNLNPNGTFKKLAPKYFKDYPDLAIKIKNKTYKWDNIIEVVDLYNEWAKNNKK